MPPNTESLPGSENEPQGPSWISMYNLDGGPVAVSKMEAGPFNWSPLSVPHSKDLEINPEQAKYFAESLGLPKDWKIQLLAMPRTLQEAPAISSTSSGKVATAAKAKTRVKQRKKYGLEIDQQTMTITLRLNFQLIEDELLDNGLKRTSQEFNTQFAQAINFVLQSLRTRFALDILTSKIAKSPHKTQDEDNEAQILLGEAILFLLIDTTIFNTCLAVFLNQISSPKNESSEIIAVTLFSCILVRLAWSQIVNVGSKVETYIGELNGRKPNPLAEYYAKNRTNAILTQYLIKHLYLPLLASVLPAHPAFIRAVPAPPSPNSR